MIDAVAKAYESKRLFRRDGIQGGLGYQRDVFLRRQAGDQVVELKHETDMIASIGGKGRVVELSQLFLLEENMPLAGRVETANDVQQGGLFAAGGAQHDNDFAAIEREIDAIQCPDRHFARMVDLRDAPGFERPFRIAADCAVSHGF